MTPTTSGENGPVAPQRDYQEELIEPEVTLAWRIFHDPSNEGRWISPVAFSFVDWLRTIVLPGCAGSVDGFYTLNTYEVDRYHDILETFVLEDDAQPAPGTIHADLQELLGCQIVHTKDPRTRKCAVQAVKTQLRVTPS